MFRNYSSSTMRGYSHSPLTLDAIRAIAPSVFAEDKHESRSDRYTYIPTSNIVTGLISEGFMPYYASQGRSNVPGKADFTKHLLKFRRESTMKENTFEIALINSHDGTSSYKMIAGCYRLVCSNGLMHFNTQYDVKVPHRGNIVHDVIEGAYSILSQQREVEGSIDKLQSITLSPLEQRAFSQAALALRYEPNEEGVIDAPISSDQLNHIRRNADAKDDLWTTFNRVQENVIKGGLQGRASTGRRISTKAITNIDNNVNLNRALWMLAESMANLKQAA
jgi:Domain of unknown function (DUF932)